MTQDAQVPRPFDGVRVIELAQWVFVPAAGALLADWGADVIHIEPLDGDPYRGLVSLGIHSDHGGVNMSMEATNRNKRSLALDISTDRGLAVLLELVDGADVFLTNVRPGALARRGLDPDSLRARNPRLVYARGHGFGARGPEADRAGYDASAFWARGGLAHILTPQHLDYPVGQRGAFGDRSGGMALAFGISSALFQRERTGEGATIDVSLLATAMWILTSDLLGALQGEEPRARWGHGGSPNPLLDQYRTKDGRHIALVFLQPDRYWVDFCRVIGRPELADDPRFADITSRAQHASECFEILDAEFASRDYKEWVALLQDLDAPWAPVQAIEELLTDPQVVANGYVTPVDTEGGPEFSLPNVPVQIDGRTAPLHRAPEHGEHTERVLLELGYDWDTIGELQREGVIP
jgi:crotonobetainyl-CoA:carnitine CoA-transferase CaiB-like acyl-CoA transferase